MLNARGRGLNAHALRYTIPAMWSEITQTLIESALAEDLGEAGDITAQLLGDTDTPMVADIVPREGGVICGLALASQICATAALRLVETLAFEPAAVDGDAVEAGQVVGTLRGPRGAVLSTERTLLNFLGRLSGVATLTRQYVDAAQAGNPRVKVLDTRKTLPGWRELDKYAVRAGGGANHRMGLHDAILIKDNHLAGVPTEQLGVYLQDLLSRRDANAAFVEVEVDTLEQFNRVLTVDAVDIVLLDNFELDDLAHAVRARDAASRQGSLELEASGGVRLETIGAIAATGVDRISVGALTHSAVSLDLGLDARG